MTLPGVGRQLLLGVEGMGVAVVEADEEADASVSLDATRFSIQACWGSVKEGVLGAVTSDSAIASQLREDASSLLSNKIVLHHTGISSMLCFFSRLPEVELHVVRPAHA